MLAFALETELGWWGEGLGWDGKKGTGLGKRGRRKMDGFQLQMQNAGWVLLAGNQGLFGSSPGETGAYVPDVVLSPIQGSEGGGKPIAILPPGEAKPHGTLIRRMA